MAGEKGVGRRRKETEEGGKDSQMMRWRSCGEHVKHLDKEKKREKILCMNYTAVCVPIGCTTVLEVDIDR